ncbi:uroporphyrinogen-III C-methyltransferase [Buchnera aphidicola (Thelaxes californica)]|uniref:Uroporphyrinogen-III C-methyltransferase n=1 Tax=Buchnera aphidicola (Thelaxes californica) TaxID=1315998 RepID=A0A4D6YJU1_9GAMM|nr:siroheme synthase CysG [Buchnera aphidicola]QCI26851.1 uroporphyrinogen-III C-methyltransferase [Buchnera aphidicola (Thelaxes californica)]
MNYFPIFLKLKEKNILVIGGGKIALRKINLLMKSQGNIKIVSKTLCADLQLLFEKKKIEWIDTIFLKKYLNNIFLVIIATNNTILNQYIFKLATKKCLFVNSVDDIDNCSCIFPSIIDRNPILISLSSSGTSPVLLKLIREKIESIIPFGINKIAYFAKKWRVKIQYFFKKIERRRYFWEKLFKSVFFNHILNNNMCNAMSVFKKIICNSNFSQGIISLVGAGPGKVGLLTLDGLQVLQNADIVFYDRLVGKKILDLIRRDADRICIGKERNKYIYTQKKIQKLLVYHALQGKKVVRLKGGDAFIFGRGGEELDYIYKKNVDFQVIPGITTAIGAAAFSGIPLTYRNIAEGIIFITGHKYNFDCFNIFEKNIKKYTIVIYMGKMYAHFIALNLIKKGLSKNTPVAVISQATTTNQIVLIKSLSVLTNYNIKLNTPILLIIGDVVKFYEKFHWFNKNIYIDKNNIFTQI